MADRRAVIVTGASRGIGRAVAIALGAAGYAVCVNYLHQAAAADEVVQTILRGDGTAIAVGADVSRREAVDELFRRTAEELGPVTVLVNNAGVTRDTLLLRLTEDDWDVVLDTNLRGPYLCTKTALRAMLKARWGRIINISSVVGITGNPGQSNYAAAKAGLIGFTRSVAREVGDSGITVNAVAPGYISTDITDVLSDETKTKILEAIPAGRFGLPEDVADVVTFLASDGARYITGQVINVDGGLVTA